MTDRLGHRRSIARPLPPKQAPFSKRAYQSSAAEPLSQVWSRSQKDAAGERLDARGGAAVQHTGRAAIRARLTSAAPARSAGMLAVLLTAHAAAAPRVQRVLAALEADLDALERMQTSAENCDPGNGWAGVMKMIQTDVEELMPEGLLEEIENLPEDTGGRRGKGRSRSGRDDRSSGGRSRGGRSRSKPKDEAKADSQAPAEAKEAKAKSESSGIRCTNHLCSQGLTPQQWTEVAEEPEVEPHRELVYVHIFHTHPQRTSGLSS